MKKNFIISLVLACAGIFVSIELVHQSASFAASGEVGCVVGNQGCLKAASSQYAVVFGTPISVFGLSFITAALLCLAGLFWRTEQEALERVFFLGSAASVAYSIFLAAVSLNDGYLCPYCASLYVINLGLFITAFISFPDRKQTGFGTLKSIRGSMAFWTVILLILASFPSSKYIYVKNLTLQKAANRAKNESKVASTEELKKHLVQARRKTRTRQPRTKKNPKRMPLLKMTEKEQILTEPCLRCQNLSLSRPETDSLEAAGAAITLVEFSDFECPYCQRFGLSLKQAVKTAPKAFNYVFKHFPLDNKCNPSIDGDFHKFSCDAAYAMICAGKSGKEWAMHDLIFENQRNLSKDIFAKFATELGLQMDTFNACLNAPETKAIVLQDITEGIKAGINGTPAVYLNGMPMAPELDGEKLGQLLNELSAQMK